MMGFPGSFELPVIFERFKHLAVVPQDAPVSVRLGPQEDLAPDQTVVGVDARIFACSVTGNPEQLFRRQEIFRGGFEIFCNPV